MRYRIEQRTLDMTTAGAEPRAQSPDMPGGPIDCAGFNKLTVSGRAVAGNWSTGVATIYGGVNGAERRALASALTVSSGTPHTRAQSVAGDTYIVPQVSTAESGVILELTFYLYDDTGANG